MTTYSQYLEDALSYVENRGAEYLAAFPRIVSRAEERVSNDLGISNIKREATTTTITGPTAYATLPAAVDFIFSIGYSTSAATTSIERFLKPRTLEYCQSYYPAFSTPSTVPPQYYAIRGKIATDPDQFQILISPPATVNSTLHVSYAAKLAGLSLSNESTMLSEHYSDLLFKAILVESAGYHTDENAMQLHTEQYKAALANTKINSDTLKTDINVIQ
jgi:hypothetical protein